jgi:hypothetical protein
MSRVQIAARLKQHYGEGALSNISILLDKPGKAGRMDHNTIASPGREPDGCLAALIAGKLDADPHLSAKKLAQFRGLQPRRFVDTSLKFWG